MAHFNHYPVSNWPLSETCRPDSYLLEEAPSCSIYKAWKNNIKDLQTNKNDTSILKKQVRFKSPTMPKPEVTNQVPTSNDNKESPCLNKKSPPLNKAFENVKFPDVYMANILRQYSNLPDADDSTNKVSLEPKPVSNNTEQKENVESVSKYPVTYREFLNMQRSENKENDVKIQTSGECITDILSYNRNKTNPSKQLVRKDKVMKLKDDSRRKLEKIDLNVSDKQKTMDYGYNNSLKYKKLFAESNSIPPIQNTPKKDSAIQTSIIDSSEEKQLCNTNNEPTVRDLLQIIQTQNEQILSLQKKVERLLEKDETKKHTEVTEQKILTEPKLTPRRKPLSKFSIDLMTSYEVSFRPQQNIFGRKRDFSPPQKSTKIQEIIENDDFDKKLNSYLPLQEPIRVEERCPSPEPTININMKEYESSDDETEETNSSINETFYKELMDQVNKVIKNAQTTTNIEEKYSNSNEIRDKFKDTTIKHLRKIGINFSTIDEGSSTSSDQSKENVDGLSNKISFVVKQLLMKYLPNEQLTEITNKQIQNQKKQNNEDKIVLTSKIPEFSIATFQFMKKYDLIATDHVTPQKITKNKETNINKLTNNPKILDITALKQQPKFL